MVNPVFKKLNKNQIWSILKKRKYFIFLVVSFNLSLKKTENRPRARF